jgi:ketosteroid isomerase-like protein
MSQENVEIVMEGIRRFDSSEFDHVTSIWHPDSWITGPEDWPETGPFEGRDAVRGQFRRLAADWGQHRISDVEVVTDQGDWVVVTLRWEARGGKSGAATATTFACALRVKDRRLCEGHFRSTIEQALEAAGLGE